MKNDLKRARAENTKANVEYDSLKAEVLKAVQGKSSLPVDVLNELLEETRQRVLDTSHRVTELTTSLGYIHQPDWERYLDYGSGV